MHTVDAAEEQSSPSYCTHLYLQKTYECNLHLQKTQKAELFNAAALKNELNFARFKSDLKTYLFREAFNL